MIEQLESTPVEQHQQRAPRRRASRMFVKLTGMAAILIVLVAAGALPRLARQRDALAAVDQSPIARPTVSLVHAQKREPVSELLLPGNIQPLYSATVYSRIDGYVERRNVDIGAMVSAGQVLAVISSPEVDQQLLQARAALSQSDASLLQARAALEQAKANAELARLKSERYLPLGEKDAVSQQAVDEAVQAHHARVADVAAANANITAAEANVAANRANVARLEQMQSFERIVAPFDGTITARNVERGDLVNAGSDAAGNALFSIAQSGILRLQVDVPQSEAINIKDGQKASINVRERPGRGYTGTVVRSASALNSAARTMLTEVQVDNKDGSLLPGMYAQVKFTITSRHPGLIIPTSSLVIDRQGMHVVAVSDSRTIHFIPVGIGRDMGTQVEVVNGLDGSESLVASPSDLLNEGQHVALR
jgi:RND family efflux transporter MFP subunit